MSTKCQVSLGHQMLCSRKTWTTKGWMEGGREEGQPDCFAMSALFTILVNDAVFGPRAKEPARLAERRVLSVWEGLVVGEGSQVRQVPSQAPTELQDMVPGTV